jgi:acyl carrier protein
MSNILGRVISVVSERLNIRPEDIESNHSFTGDLGADSLDTVEIVMALEEEFDVEIPDEDAEKITTIQEAVDSLTEKLG